MVGLITHVLYDNNDTPISKECHQSDNDAWCQQSYKTCSQIVKNIPETQVYGSLSQKLFSQ